MCAQGSSLCSCCALRHAFLPLWNCFVHDETLALQAPRGMCSGACSQSEVTCTQTTTLLLSRLLLEHWALSQPSQQMCLPWCRQMEDFPGALSCKNWASPGSVVQGWTQMHGTSALTLRQVTTRFIQYRCRLHCVKAVMVTAWLFHLLHNAQVPECLSRSFIPVASKSSCLWS